MQITDAGYCALNKRDCINVAHMPRNFYYFFYQMCGILFYFWYVINMAGREISTIGDFIKMNFRPIPDYIERRAVARSKTQQAFGYAFCFRKNKKGERERERERRKKKNGEGRENTNAIHHYTDRCFSVPLKPKLRFFSPRFPFRSGGASIVEFNSRTREIILHS